MISSARLSHTAAIILHAIAAGHSYGFSIMKATGLPSGTIYSAMRRMEQDELISSLWEEQAIADKEQRPPRKYYKVTDNGQSVLEISIARYPLLQGMFKRKARV